MASHTTSSEMEFTHRLYATLSKKCHEKGLFFGRENFIINNFSRAILPSRKSLSADWDSNPDPSVSGRVPLPLDHLHSCFSLLFNSYPRAVKFSAPITHDLQNLFFRGSTDHTGDCVQSQTSVKENAQQNIPIYFHMPEGVA